MTAAEKQTQSKQTREISGHTAAMCDKQLELANKQTEKSVGIFYIKRARFFFFLEIQLCFVLTNVRLSRSGYPLILYK